MYVWPLASLWLEPLYCHWLSIWYCVVPLPVYLTMDRGAPRVFSRTLYVLPPPVAATQSISGVRSVILAPFSGVHTRPAFSVIEFGLE